MTTLNARMHVHQLNRFFKHCKGIISKKLFPIIGIVDFITCFSGETGVTCSPHILQQTIYESVMSKKILTVFLFSTILAFSACSSYPTWVPEWAQIIANE